MAHTFEELRKKRVADLRQMAEGMEHEALKGFTAMRKDDLVQALCVALGIESHVHHEVVGLDKAGIKAKIRELKTRKAAALESKDRIALKRARRRIHRLKRRLRSAIV